MQMASGPVFLRQEACYVNGPPMLNDNEVFDFVAEFWKPNVAQGVKSWLEAMQVEVSTRFLQYSKQTVLPPPEMIDIAQHILQRGLVKHPQSVYLQLQYALFLVAYRRNYLAAHSLLQRLEDLYPLNFHLAFSVFRKRKDLIRMQQESHFGGHQETLDTMYAVCILHACYMYATCCMLAVCMLRMRGVYGACMLQGTHACMHAARALHVHYTHTAHAAGDLRK